jgi:thioredoxin-like negative regulator of GroEL
MVDKLRTAIARFMVQHVPHPHPLVVAAWLWLAAKTEDIEEKKRCFNSILALDPDNTETLLALAVLYSEKGNDHTP